MKNTAAEGFLLGKTCETFQIENEIFDFWVSILHHYQWNWCLEEACHLNEVSDPLRHASPTNFWALLNHSETTAKL